MSTVAATSEDGSTESSSEDVSVRGLPEALTEVQKFDGDGLPATRVVERPETAAELPGLDTATLPLVLKIVGSVVAPTTLLTALMIYFGHLHAAGFSWYLGVQVTALDLTVQDYLISSADGLIPPLIAVAGAALLALWVHQLLLGVLSTGIRRIVLRMLMPFTVITGLVLISLAVPVFSAFPEARGLSLSLGVLLLAYAARLLRLLIAQRRPGQLPRHAPTTATVAEWGAVFILVSVGLFWAVGSYAIGVGTGRAQLLEASLPSYADVVIYSKNRLHLQGLGVREEICQYPDAADLFRYEGIKLVLQSGNQYLFLPSGWAHANGTAILIPRSEALRLEFSSPGQVKNTAC